ncbi:hypothetical protein GCM10009111_24120 [Colwellia asteriadis]|uniref:Uncharacterized protein n=1 Tax=Colwellia asteriadis TaxID=517723 RepID=A0ABP3WJB0_9GAMM
MIINTNYAQQVEQARVQSTVRVDSNNQVPIVNPIPGQKDTLTLSDKALAMISGETVKESAPTYTKPETARALLAQQAAIDEANNPNATEAKVTDSRFGEMMQSILDKRLGVDSEKLQEIEDEMELIANDKSMSPEEKQQALEALTEKRDEIIEENIKNNLAMTTMSPKINENLV